MESQRHDKGKCLALDEVLDDTVEVSLFSSPDGVYEIYVSYAGMDGIVYVNEADVYLRREEIRRIKNRQMSLLWNSQINTNWKFRLIFILTIPLCFVKTEENLTGFSFLFRMLYYNKDSDCGKRRKKRND